MGAAITHEDFHDYDSSEEVSEEPARPSERYMQGGRDTVLLVWGVIALLVAGFMLCAAAAGEPPAPTQIVGT